MAKVNATFSIDENIKKTFKIETTINSDEMSSLIEKFMNTYNELSKSRRQKDG